MTCDRKFLLFNGLWLEGGSRAIALRLCVTIRGTLGVKANIRTRSAWAGNCVGGLADRLSENGQRDGDEHQDDDTTSQGDTLMGFVGATRPSTHRRSRRSTFRRAR